MKHRLLIILTLVLLVGCHSHRDLTQPTPSDADSTAVATTDKKTCFAANFQCDLRNVRLSGMMRMQEDSILWVSVSKIVELGRAKLTPDSIIVYSRATQQFFRGTYADAQTLSGYTVDFAQLQELFMTAFRERKRDVDLVLKGRKRQDTLHLVFTHYTAVREQTYPLTIPNRARTF